MKSGNFNMSDGGLAQLEKSYLITEVVKPVRPNQVTHTCRSTHVRPAALTLQFVPAADMFLIPASSQNFKPTNSLIFKAWTKTI